MYSKNRFPNQKENEETIFFLRRHWIVVVKILVSSIGLSLIPLIFYFGFSEDMMFLESVTGYALFVLFISAYYLFIILFTFTNFIDYYLDVWIVTSERVVNIEQKGLFRRELSEKELGRMQDITSDVKGFWASLLEYGDVIIQTAGETSHFVFKQVPHAEEVTRAISNVVAKYREEHESAEENTEYSSE